MTITEFQITIKVEKGTTDRRLAPKIKQNNRLKFSEDLGDYFCDLLLATAYPRPKAVSTRLTTAIKPSIVTMAIIAFSYKFPKQ